MGVTDNCPFSLSIKDTGGAGLWSSLPGWDLGTKGCPSLNSVSGGCLPPEHPSPACFLHISTHSLKSACSWGFRRPPPTLPGCRVPGRGPLQSFLSSEDSGSCRDPDVWLPSLLGTMLCLKVKSGVCFCPEKASQLGQLQLSGTQQNRTTRPHVEMPSCPQTNSVVFTARPFYHFPLRSPRGASP